MSFKSELEDLINKHSIGNDSNTPDFILANYINKCLINFADTVNARDCWYSKNPKFANSLTRTPELDVYTTCNSKTPNYTPPDLSLYGNRPPDLSLYGNRSK